MNEQQLRRLAEGYTGPAYVFDLAALKERVAFLRANLPENISLCYAIKANAFLTRALEGTVERFEVCSPGEYAICQQLGIPREMLVISGVYKTPSFILDLAAQHPETGSFTAESPEQYRLLAQAARAAGRPLNLLLRLTAGSQFGMDEEALRAIVRDRAQEPLLRIRGIQFFSGTQKRSLKKLGRELEKLDRLLLSLRADYGYEAEELEYGPGFPVCYFQSEEFDEPDFLAQFSRLLSGMAHPAHVTLELGRSIAASCGSYLTQVVDAKVNRGERYAILDGGMHHLVYFGQTMAMKVPHYQLYPPRDAGEPLPWNLCGALCTTNDILVKQLPVAGLQVGDFFLFENTGAYCMIEGISLFLSRALPRVLLLLEDGTLLPVREAVETYPLNTPDYSLKGID